MNLNKHIPKAYATAIKRGFFLECKKCDGFGEIHNDGINKHGNIIGDIDCPSCNGSGIDQNIPISKLIMDVIEEVAEARKAFRLERRELGETSITKECPDEDYIWYYGEYFQNTFESELADIIIVILSICGYYGIELNDYNFTSTLSIDELLLIVCDDLYKYTLYKQGFKRVYKKYKHQLSFVYSTIINICTQKNIDIEKHLELKMKYNELREN